MIIQGSSIAFSSYSAIKRQAAERQFPATEPATLADKVTISEAGKQAASSDASASGVEIYAIPDWLADFGFILESKVATVQADGTLSGGTRGDWFERKYPEAAAAATVERAKYSRLIDEHYQSVLKENGVNDTVSHYQALIQDKASSENLRLQMIDSIKADPVLMALLPKMGKASLIN